MRFFFNLASLPILMETRRAWDYSKYDLHSMPNPDFKNLLKHNPSTNDFTMAFVNAAFLTAYGGLFRNVLTRVIFRRLVMRIDDFELPLSREEFQTSYRSALKGIDDFLSHTNDESTDWMKELVKKQIDDDLTDPYTTKFPSLLSYLYHLNDVQKIDPKTT